jgi:hypothetical protein
LAPNDKKGDPLRNAMQKVNLNFSALNTAIQGVLDGKGQANGYASLGADGRLLAAQAPVVYSAALPTTTHDLNTYVTPGTFYQTTIAGATAGANYPTVNVGFLEVVGTGTPVMQVYTTRTATVTAMQRFWRVRMSATSWSMWKELSDATTAFNYQGGLASGVDLNNYTQRGMWAQGSSAGAAAGSNYPIAQSGVLLVYSAGYPGGTPATGCNQIYVAANSNRMFFRSLVGATWTNWEESVRSSLLGSASGIAQLGADSRLLAAQAPILYSSVILAGTDANSVIAPGVYYLNGDAQATAALNWPIVLAGTLTVEVAITGNSQVTQTYSTRNGTGGAARTYKRVRFGAGAGTWGTWQELARYDDAMTHVYLGAAGVDCNTLVADNTFYTIDQAGAVTSGSNWPPTSSIIGGSVEVRRQAASRVHQTVTLIVGSNQKPRIFFRYGDPVGNSWQSWTMISSISAVGWLPTANCGDVYVDGVGWHRWNGSAYEMSALAPWLPTAAHDLNNYTAPGEFCQSSTAGAVAGTNYPVAIGGFLKVTQGAGINGTVQEYTVRSAAAVSASAGPRRYWRVRDGSSWSPWHEVLTTALGMTHIFLTAATDANTLTADNTSYTWTASAVAGGANFPGYSAAGYMQVFWQAATVVSQELTLLVTGGKPLKFARFGNTSTGVWQPWKVISAFNSTSWMPTSNMGDIYVDGLGWHAWDGAAYKLTFGGRDHGQCRFAYVSTILCTLFPIDGNGLIINGRQYRVPSAGVSIANTAFTAQTLMYVYAYDNGSGAIALEASTTTHVRHTDGVRIKSGDPSRTLVGMAQTENNNIFLWNGTNRYVATWFNRRQSAVQEYFSAGTASVNSPVMLNNGCGCLAWAGDSLTVSVMGQTYANMSAGSYVAARVNSLHAAGNYGYSCTSPGVQVPIAMHSPWGVTADGVHRLTCWAYANTNGASVYFGADTTIVYEG